MPKSDNTLTTTLVGEWIISEEDRTLVENEMRLFQCAVRTAFNRLLEGMDKSDVEKRVASMFHLNSRYAKDARIKAQSIISSQREMVKLHKKEKESLISELRKKLENIKSEEERENISARIEQLKEEVAVLSSHVEKGTIPKVIFGGRENFEKRRDGKLSKEQWKNLRNNKLYSRGDKSKEGGNLNTKIEIVDSGFSLSVAISHLSEKNKTAPRVMGKLFLDIRHRDRLKEHLEDSGIYSIELIRGTDNKYRVHITFGEFVPSMVCSFRKGAIGVDVNPDGIALTEIDKEGNFRKGKWIALPELAYCCRNRRENLCCETAKEIVDIALSLNIGLVIESLDFVRLNKGKRFNRMSHNFVYRRLLEAIERRAVRCGVLIKKVHPAYTSIIGKYKYATALGLSFHQSAALVIARRGLGFRERIPKKIQRLIESLITSQTSLLPAMEAKGKREVLRLKKKVENWRNLHSWSFWYTFEQSIRKVGVKPWLLRDINSVINYGILPREIKIISSER
jgi:IS605 OrfB family transposase